jgi:ABC-2 type transport system ATP-binding protein
MSVIRTRNLTKYYGKSRGIIDVNLDVEKGEIFGFIGPNGAGKSTTIRTLLSFIHPTYGKSEIFNMDCFRESEKIKKKTGYISSDVNYYDDMRVNDLLSYSAKFYRKDCTKRINELADIFDVELDRKIESLSFGNRKKVGILQAFIHEPELLILDEPTSSLDPLMQKSFYELLLEENRKGTTIFLSSHILNEVQKICSRVGIIKEGKLLKVESIESIRANKYKKIKVELKNEINAESLECNGVENLEIKGKQIEFLFAGTMGIIVKELSNLNIENLWIEEPSLEEVFIHYYEKEGG